MKILIMTYYSILILTVNEIAPVTAIERLVCTVLLLLSFIVNTLLLGKIVYFLVILNLRSQIFQNKVDIANTVMQSIEMSVNDQL